MLKRLLSIAGHPAILAGVGTLALVQAITVISERTEQLSARLAEVGQRADVLNDGPVTTAEWTHRPAAEQPAAVPET